MYTPDNPDCAPPHLYLNENIRVYAKEQRARRATTAIPTTRGQEHGTSNTTNPRRRVQSADVAYRFGKRVRLPEHFADNEYLTHEGLTMGQKQYIWGIARCYSMDNLKLLNERRLKTVLDQELDRRLKTPSLSRETKENLLKEYKASTRAIEKRTVKICLYVFML